MTPRPALICEVARWVGGGPVEVVGPAFCAPAALETLAARLAAAGVAAFAPAAMAAAYGARHVAANAQRPEVAAMLSRAMLPRRAALVVAMLPGWHGCAAIHAAVDAAALRNHPVFLISAPQFERPRHVYR
jgi:hypothetical protein